MLQVSELICNIEFVPKQNSESVEPPLKKVCTV